MNRAIVTSILCGLLAFGCGGEEEAPTAEQPAAEQPAAQPAAGATAEAEDENEPTADEVPIPEDFEDEAAAEITAENYREQLDALAAEIEADEGDEG